MKRVRWRFVNGLQAGRFPSSTEDGSIEAMLSSVQSVRELSFRPQLRTAPLKRTSATMVSGLCGGFRPQLRTAPLKPELGPQPAPPAAAFPSSTEDGSIEAWTPHYRATIIAGFRPQLRTAPLKLPRPEITDPALVRFRPQLRTAPLKRALRQIADGHRCRFRPQLRTAPLKPRGQELAVSQKRTVSVLN